MERDAVHKAFIMSLFRLDTKGNVISSILIFFCLKISV